MRYAWDLLKYLPVTIVIDVYASRAETQLEVLKVTAYLFPLAFLPMMYVVQRKFQSEASAQVAMILLQLIVMVLFPFAEAIMRLGVATLELGAQMAWIFRLFPAYPLSRTVMFNQEMLSWLADQRFEVEGEEEAKDDAGRRL